MANRFGKADASYNGGSTFSSLNSASTNQRLAQSFTALASGNVSYIGISINSIVGTPSGNVWLELRAPGANPEAGALLGTSNAVAVSALSVSTFNFFFSSLPSITASSVYYIVMKCDYATSSSNYITWGAATTSAYSGGTNYTFNGTTWTDLSRDNRFAVYLNSDGGSFDIDSDGSGPNGEVTNADRISIKGAALSVNDTGYVYNGKTVLFDANESCKQWVIGDTSLGAAVAGQKYGFIKVNAGVTLTFLGDATSTNSGFYSNPTTPGAESINSKVTISGTVGSRVVFVNSIGALNTSYKWTIALLYGYVDVNYCDVKYFYANAFNGLRADLSKTSVACSIKNLVSYNNFHT
jgi:hypothetical protein